MGINNGVKGDLVEDHAYRLKSKIELLKTKIEKMILVKISSNRNQKMFNFEKSIKIEIVSFLKDQTEIENFEIDPALVFGHGNQDLKPVDLATWVRIRPEPAKLTQPLNRSALSLMHG